MSSVGRLVIGSDDDEYDNRADFAAEDTHYGEDLERRQMLDASSEAEHGDKRAGRDELKRFLHAQKTHGRRNTLACCGALALLLVTILVSDTPHNYLARDEVRQAVPPLPLNPSYSTDKTLWRRLPQRAFQGWTSTI